MDLIAHSQTVPKSTVQGRRGYACTFCRRRKFKCDGRNPCRSCIKGKQTCSYDNSSHRTPTQLLQDRIDELQSKIASIESHGKARSSLTTRPPSVPSQKQFSPNGYAEGPYVFSSNAYPIGPSHSLFASTSNQQYVADYVPSECSSSSSSHNLDFGFGNYATNTISDTSTCRNSPSIACWEPQPPAFEISSPQMPEAQPAQVLGRDGTIPAPLAEKIMFHFLTHRFRSGLLSVHRTQPQNLSTQRHPALLSVCYLLGCFFCPDGSLAHLEATFVERTRRALEDAIDLTQDPSHAIDYLLASSSLAQYLYTKGRLLEGYHRAISGIRFAVNQGFHMIKPISQDVLDMQDPAHVQAVLEHEDRERVWWHIWCIDRWGSLLTGLPCGIADADIQTPWPLPPDLIDPTHPQSVMSLYSPDAEAPVLTSDPGYSNGYKAIALLERASVKASSAHMMAPEVWAAEHAMIKNAIARFAAALDVQTSDVAAGTVLAITHTMVYAATCALHMPYIRQWAHDENRTAQRNHLRTICREGAATAVAILRTLTVSTYLVSAIQGLPLAALCEFLLQERDDLIDELDFTEQSEVDKQLDELMGWMNDMKGTFPILGMQVEKLEARRR